MPLWGKGGGNARMKRTDLISGPVAPLLFVTVPLTRSIKTVAAAYPVTWGLTALCMCVYYLSVNGTFKRETENI